MHCWIELSKKNLQKNFQIFQKISGASEQISVLKSNAYGHGLEVSYEILKSEDPQWLGVNYIWEGQLLRSKGYQKNILAVGPIQPSCLTQAYQEQVQVFVGDYNILQAWLDCDNKPKIHIKFDTGMSRQGFPPEDAENVGKELLPYKDLVIACCSHFANVEDVLEHDYAEQQLEKFLQAKEELLKTGLSIKGHISSSASSLILKQSLMDFQRIGISLYGLWPSQATRLSYLQIFSELADLQPVLSWKTIVSTTKTVRKGQFIGYGCTYKAMRDMKIAVLPIGYYEGYPRSATNFASYVLIKGSRCPVVGRICMNMMMIDISHHTSVRARDEVVLIGKSGEESIEASSLAEWSGTIHYELLTRLNEQIPRKVVP